MTNKVKEKYYGVGVKEVCSSLGNMLRVYDEERTFCDLIRKRNTLDKQDLQTA